MALIDFDKFLASFITEMKECSQMRTFSIPRCIKKALDDQGLEYKDGEIVKTQRMVSSDVKEDGYGVSEDERIMEKIIATIHLYYGEPLEDEAKEMIAWFGKQGTSYTKRDVDDAYVEGMAFAKDELEKQKLTEWSKEDEKRLNSCLNILQPKSLLGNVETINTMWLKSLKNRIIKENKLCQLTTMI